MYISRIVVRNFRNFHHFDVSLGPGVTCIVGENNTGKTNLLHALRLAVDASLSSTRRHLIIDDFPVGMDISKPAQSIVSIELSGFAGKPHEEAIAFGGHIADDKARVTYRFRPQRSVRSAINDESHPGEGLTLDDYRWEITIGGAKDPAEAKWDDELGVWLRFEDLHQAYLVVFLEPLRDVESRLRQSRYSPLTQLLTQADVSVEEQQQLVDILENANASIGKSGTVKKLGSDISTAFTQAAGDVFSMAVNVGMTAPSFNDVARSLSLLLSDDWLKDFSPAQNGLGLNNVLYICMQLKYFERRVKEAKTAGQLLIIEEPEAHLHPQLQRVLFRALQQTNSQSILTTHSTHITSQAPLSSIVVLTNSGSPATTSTVPAKKIDRANVRDLERYLDATRATLLYARKVMLVEGPAELFLIPELVRSVLGYDLDEKGITVVPIYGIHFDAYASLFGPDKVKKKCAVVADGDLEPSDASVTGEPDGLEDADLHKPKLADLENDFVRAFTCETTFERELAYARTLTMFAEACSDLGATRLAAKLRKMANIDDEDEAYARTVLEAGTTVLRAAKRFGKARFAQVVSAHADLAESLPPYIENALRWLNEDEVEPEAAKGS